MKTARLLRNKKFCATFIYVFSVPRAPGLYDYHLSLPGGASKTISTGLFSITDDSSGLSGSGSGIGSNF